MRGSLWQPTDLDRRVCAAMAAYGTPQVEIARALGISDRSLRKHLSVELASGCAMASADVAMFLLGAIVGTESQPAFEDEHDRMIAAIFWLRCRGGWHPGPEVLCSVGAMTDAQLDIALGIEPDGQAPSR
jgi:hypothetical protein